MSEEIRLHDYSIVISENLDGLATWLSGPGERQYFLITDENTNRHCLPLLQEACERWPLSAATAVHRVGRLGPGEQIVWVGAASAHREAAFAACEFIMDYLKTRAPFWKKEQGPHGERWVGARQADDERADRWR